MKSSSDSFSVIAFSLPDEYFPDDDDACATAGTYIAQQLGAHLEKCGHTIPDWVKGGCREDAWVYLESKRGEVRCYYDILFFPRSGDTHSMAVRYGAKVSFWRQIFHGMSHLSSADPVHHELRTYGGQHEKFEHLTASQFDARL